MKKIFSKQQPINWLSLNSDIAGKPSPSLQKSAVRGGCRLLQTWLKPLLDRLDGEKSASLQVCSNLWPAISKRMRDVVALERISRRAQKSTKLPFFSFSIRINQ